MAFAEFELRKKYERSAHNYSVELVNNESWPKVRDGVRDLWKEQMGWDPDDKVLGELDSDVITENLDEIIGNPKQHMMVVKDEKGRVRAMTLLMDNSEMYPRNESTAKKVYLYAVCTNKQDEGAGLIGPLLDAGIYAMAGLGYRYMEFHARVDEDGKRGFATVSKGVFSNSIIEEEGPKIFFSTEETQMRYLIDIEHYLLKR